MADRTTVTPHPDEELLCAADENICGAVSEAINSLAVEKHAWDMSLIGPLADKIKDFLKAQNIPCCRPWEDEEQNICYSLPDRCDYCTRGGNGAC